MESNRLNGYAVEIWKATDDLQQMEYAQYWNDEEPEKNKQWWILDGNFQKMETYLQQSQLLPQLQQALEFVRTILGTSVSGCGADLASGSLWAIPYLLAAGDVQKLYAVEYSRHRLLKLGPKVLEHYRVPLEKVILCQGSFYEIQVEKHSLDFVLLSAAFHHAEAPDQLLTELSRVLKADGFVIMIGEHITKSPSLRAKVRHAAKFILSRALPQSLQTRLFGRILQAQTFFPTKLTDPVLGDHYYTEREYLKLFTKAGFQHHNLRLLGCEFQSFILVRREESRHAQGS